MITIQTVTSKIINNDGSNASGYLIVRANDEFEFTNSGARRKVTTEGMIQNFEDGVLDASFSIAPTLNASQDKENLYFTVQFFTNSAKWTEYWVIDAAGDSTLEITAVTKVIVSPVASTVFYIPSDDVSIEPADGGIPRADGDGLIDPGWIIGATGTLVYSFTEASLGGTIPETPAPSGVLIAIGYSASKEQTFVWAGNNWRVIGG